MIKLSVDDVDLYATELLQRQMILFCAKVKGAVDQQQ